MNDYSQNYTRHGWDESLIRWLSAQAVSLMTIRSENSHKRRCVPCTLGKIANAS